MNRFRKIVWTATGVLALSLFALPGVAQDRKVLRVADHLPAGHFISEYAAKPWMEAVTKATNGAVTFEYYPAQQLGKAKDMLSLTVSGVADVAYVGPAYISEKMPLSAVAELPGKFATSCEGTMAFYKLAKDGVLAKRELAPNGVRLLFTYVFAPYQIYNRDKKIEKPSDFQGMKMRSTGGPMDLMVERLQGVPVRMPAPEVYESLSRGTVDSVVFPLSALLDYKLQGLVKYATQGENFGSFVAAYVISERLWKTLPANVQKAMVEAGEAITKQTCERADKDIAPNLEKLKQAGVTVVSFSPEQKKEISSLLAPVAKEWAEGLDKRGKPGTEVLKAFDEVLKSAK